MRALKALNSNDGVEEPEVDLDEKKTVKKRQRFIQPIIDHFRRNKRGVKLIQQEVERLLEKQVKLFPNKAMLDMDKKTCTYSYNGESGNITKEELILKAPVFFDHYFVQIRRKVEYGSKVHGWLTGIDAKMVGEYRFKDLHELVWLIATSKFTETTGFAEEDDSSGAEAAGTA